MKHGKLLPVCFDKTTNYALTTFFYALFLTNTLSAQDYIVNLQQYGIEDGLSHREVNAIVKDKQGFLWLGTPYGLNRFDGYKFKWWTKEKDGLDNNDINKLVFDAGGYLWIINAGNRSTKFDNIRSISILDVSNEKVCSFKEKFGDDLTIPVSDIGKHVIKDKDNVLYLGTGNGARMISYHPDAGFQIFPLKGHETFLPIGISTRQSIWAVADGDHLIEVSKKGQILQSHPQPYKINWRRVQVMDNEVLFSNNLPRKNFTLFKIDENGQQHVVPNNEMLAFESIKQFHYDPFHNYLWLVNQGRLRVFSENNLLLDFSKQYPQLMEDRGVGWRGALFDPSGNIWLGGDFGLYQLEIRQNKFSRYLFEQEWAIDRSTNSHSQAENISCRGIYSNGQTLYVNAERESFQIIDLAEHSGTSKNSRKIIDLQMIPEMKNIYALTKSKDKNLWIGQYGLQRFDPETESVEVIFKTDNTSHLEIIWTIYEENDSTLWLGGSNGLQSLNRTNKTVQYFENYQDFQLLAKSLITHINIDNEGLIWICSNTGLYTMDSNNKITTRYWSGGKGEFYLPHDHFYHFYQDAQNIYWLATAGGGLIRWDRKNNQTRQFTKEDGLSNNVIYAIYEDEKEHLWMSSDYGIIQFDKKTFRPRAYLESDGITHHEFNRISHFQGDDGHIYFGGLNGVTAFNPNNFHQLNSSEKAALQVTEFLQFDGASNELVNKTAELRQSNEIKLYPDDRFFRLGFSLLTYEAPEQKQYAYKIDGVDNDWTYQREPFIRMGRLPYGNHLLQIKGQAANGQWSSNTLSIPIQSIRPFYLQSWFIGISLLALFALGIAGIKWRTWQYKKTQKTLEAEVINQTATIREQTEKLKALDAAKSRFYTNITHEFRTPLTVIIGMLENIKGHFNERQLIRRNSKNLLRLVNQLLDLSKLESGTMKMKAVQGDIVHYLRYLTESFYSMAEEKKVRLTFYSEDQEVLMDFDETKVQHIIYNLLSNAIKFTPENGKVILHVRQIREEQQNFLQLKVQDTGIGIPADQLPFIFDRFYQADDSTTRKGEGTGIGLSLTKELVIMMGGTITVNSTLDKGSEFTILFPVKRSAPIRTTENKRLFTQSKSEEITEAKVIATNGSASPLPLLDMENNEKPLLLIIEDNRDVITYIDSILKETYQIEQAHNGQKGIDKALEIIPDIIITDVMMPEKDGYEVCTTLKSDERTNHIPIIMLTARASTIDRISGLETGADAYLSKPFDKKELLIRLEKLIASRKALQEKYTKLSLSVANNNTPIAKVNGAPNMNDIFLQKIRTVIDQNLEDSELGILQLCRAVKLSHTQVYRKIKALTGEHPTGFIRKIRLHKAKELLLNSELNVSEIAYKVGFTDPNYFSRSFSQEFGEPPSAIRKVL